MENVFSIKKKKDCFFGFPLSQDKGDKILRKHTCFLNYNYIFKQTICWWCNCKRCLKLSCLYLIHRTACYKGMNRFFQTMFKFTCKLWLCKAGFILDHIFFLMLWKWTILTIATNVLWESCSSGFSIYSSLVLKGTEIIHITCECQ